MAFLSILGYERTFPQITQELRAARGWLTQARLIKPGGPAPFIWVQLCMLPGTTLHFSGFSFPLCLCDTAPLQGIAWKGAVIPHLSDPCLPNPCFLLYAFHQGRRGGSGISSYLAVTSTPPPPSSYILPWARERTCLREREDVKVFKFLTLIFEHLRIFKLLCPRTLLP